MAINISVSHSPTDLRKTIHASFDEVLNRAEMMGLMEEIIRLIAERYVKENYAQLVAGLDQQAIANLAIAESGKKIAEQIAARPVVIHDTKTNTEVYERGFFGGTRRVR